MSEPEKNQFACIGCGAMNPIGAEVCVGCGHRLTGPESKPSATAESSAISALASRSVPARGSLIRSILLAILLVAIGIGLFFAFPPLGIAYLIAGFVAMVWSWIVAYRRVREGQPISFGEKLQIFAEIMAGAFLVLISSAIAFIATCLPIGLSNFEGANGSGMTVQIAFGVGGLAALLVGGGVTYLLIRKSRARNAKKRLEERP